MIRDFISLFFPYYCHGCYQALVKSEDVICVKCMANLPKTNFHLLNESPIKAKLYNLQKLKYGLSYLKFIKGGTVQRLMHKMKYENRPQIGEKIGYWYGKELESVGLENEVDLIVPIPLHSSKMKKRGYNQSSYFAAGLAKALQKPWYDDLVVRVVKSSTQTKKSKVERWQNVSGIFKVVQPDKIVEKHVLLVDDVLTTGSTMEACGVELEQYCKTLSVATIAIA